jgi:hypothetical protein
MTSEKRRAANRANGRKSRGPKTPRGKESSCRNAIKHGLSTVSSRNPSFFARIEQTAKAICGDDQNPALFAEAIVIAENDLLLRLINTEKAAIIDRFRNPYATSVGKRTADIAMAKILIRQRDLAYDEFSQLHPKLVSQGVYIFTFLGPRKVKPEEPVYKYEPLKDRDEYEAIQVALPDLSRLLRYERRAWSRRKKAVQMFAAIKALSIKAS